MEILKAMLSVYIFIMLISVIVYLTRTIMWFNKDGDLRKYGKNKFIHDVFFCAWTAIPILVTAFAICVVCVYFINSLIF